MNVRELREVLAKLPDDMQVILQKDAEGNGYSPLCGGDEGMYQAESTWSGDVYITPEQLAEKLAEPNSRWDAEDDAPPEDSIRVLVLWPVN